MLLLDFDVILGFSPKDEVLSLFPNTAAAGSHWNKPFTISPSLFPLPSPSFQPSPSPSSPPFPSVSLSLCLLCLWWGLNPEPLACKVHALPLNCNLNPKSSLKLLTLDSLPLCRLPLLSANCSLGCARHFSFVRSYLSIVGSKIFTLPLPET